jgi:hypothetical protein
MLLAQSLPKIRLSFGPWCGDIEKVQFSAMMRCKVFDSKNMQDGKSPEIFGARFLLLCFNYSGLDGGIFHLHVLELKQVDLGEGLTGFGVGSFPQAVFLSSRRVAGSM